MTNVMSIETIDTSVLSETIQDYLSLIYVMERDGEPVVGSHLAELLGVKPPTVTATLKRMVRDGLVCMDDSGTHLTEQGLAASKVVMRRHMLMEWMMQKTLPWSKLHSEAHHLEHAISAMAESALMEQLGRPKTCPHGNPLPGCESAVADWVRLLDLSTGDFAIIRRIHELAEENTELLSYLEKNQIMPGEKVEVVEILPFNQTVTIAIDDRTVTLGNTVAKYIFAEPSRRMY